LHEEKILFAGDLFANHLGHPSLPPAIFNDDGQIGKESVRLAARMNLRGVFLNHGSRTSAEEGLRALIHLADDL
jgi:hypothetical protein